MTLTELLLLGLQTLAFFLVAAPLSVVAVLLVAAVVLVTAVVLAAAVVLVVAELLVQGPLKGSVFACVPRMTVFPTAGSKNAVLLFAGSWA
jgi:hypothetical protein